MKLETNCHNYALGIKIEKRIDVNKISKTFPFKEARVAFVLSIAFVAIHLVQYYGEVNMNSIFGLKPRSLQGLFGVIFSPFLHGSFSHLMSNIPSFFFLTWALFYMYKPIAKKVFTWGWVITGVWTWIFAQSGNHVGASGMVYFLVIFLFFSGLIRKEKSLISLSLVVVFYHAGIIWGVVPWENLIGEEIWRLTPEQLRMVYKVSWEGHLMGAITGAILAFYLKKEGPQKNEIPMDDDLTHLEEKYGEEYWLKKKETTKPKFIFPIKYIYIRKKNEDDSSSRDME